MLRVRDAGQKGAVMSGLRRSREDVLLTWLVLGLGVALWALVILGVWKLVELVR